MEKKGVLTKVLAVVGTALVCFPFFAAVVTSMVGSVVGRGLRFDYLLPAELFPIALAGGALLLWAALRARSRRGLVGWSLAVAVVGLVAGQALAVATGLASGEIEPGGWQWALVVASIVIYSIALVVIAGAGALLVRDLFQRRKMAGVPAETAG